MAVLRKGKHLLRISISVKWIMVWLLIGFYSPFNATAEAQKLKVALLPIFDALPFYVAEAKGYYKDEKIEITTLTVGSALERDQLMQVGEIDGALNEMIAVANFNRNQILAKVVGFARIPASNAPIFRILSAPKSQLKTPMDLAGVPIGVSRNTIIEYVTDKMLEAKGLPTQKINKKSVPVIPERYQLLLQGQIKAATLPDPLAKSAMAAGAIQIVNDLAFSHISVSVLSFSQKALMEKPKAVRHFLRGWYRAAAEISAEPDKYRSVLLKNIRVPGNILKTFTIPPFPGAGVPSSKQWEEVIIWMLKKGLIEKHISYSDSVTEAYLP